MSLELPLTEVVFIPFQSKFRVFFTLKRLVPHFILSDLESSVSFALKKTFCGEVRG